MYAEQSIGGQLEVDTQDITAFQVVAEIEANAAAWIDGIEGEFTGID